MIDPVTKNILSGLMHFYEAFGSAGWIRGNYQDPVMQDLLRQNPELIPDLQDIGVL